MFSYANWGNNPDNGRSMSSYLMMANAPTSFKAGIQTLIAMSTMEAELVAAALAMKDIVCSNMMMELGSEAESRPHRCTSTTIPRSSSVIGPTVLEENTWACGSSTSTNWSKRARLASTTYQRKTNSLT